MNNSEYDVIIAGAGPAGLFAAACAADAGLKVCLLEKMKSAGRKLLISGSGQCNITNTMPLDEFIRHYGDKTNFVKKALFNFKPDDLLSWFEDEGVEFTEEKNGKIFPAGRKSRQILDALLLKCRDCGVKIFYHSEVVSAVKAENVFKIKTKDGSYSAPFLILTTGGMSYPLTGSSGDGYRIAGSLGQNCTVLVPALNSVSVYGYFLKNCSGISVNNAKVEITRSGKKIASNEDDLLFTHRGLSGPVILNICRYVRPEDELCIELAGNYETFLSEFKKAVTENGKSDVKNVIQKFSVPERLVSAILEHQGIDASEKCANLSKEKIRKTAEAFSLLKFRVKTPDGFDTAMATAGGISLSEINPLTMESKISSGLYFAGEIMDVDGDTGGYNLQWAFSSARAAAEAIIKSVQNQK